MQLGLSNIFYNLTFYGKSEVHILYIFFSTHLLELTHYAKVLSQFD